MAPANSILATFAQKSRHTRSLLPPPNGSRLSDLCDLCVKKLRPERGIHTEITKNTKERMTTDLRVTQTGSVLAIFAISVCQTPIRKDDPYRNRKERKETDDHGSKGHPNRVRLSDLCDLCVSNSDQKKRSTQRSQRTQRNG